VVGQHPYDRDDRERGTDEEQQLGTPVAWRPS
jgi:hypothetical protein